MVRGGRRVFSGVLAGGLVLVALLVSGCQGDPGEDGSSSAASSPEETVSSASPSVSSPSPTPSPSPSPSASPSLSEEEVLTAEAIAALEDYVALINKIENAGGEGWEALYPWWGTPELVADGEAYYTTLVESGLYTVGSTTTSHVSVIALVPDPTGAGLARATVEYCFDLSGSILYKADGSIDESAVPTPFLATTSLQKQGVGARWTVNAHVFDLDAGCTP